MSDKNVIERIICPLGGEEWVPQICSLAECGEPIRRTYVAVDALLSDEAIEAGAVGGRGWGLHPKTGQIRQILEASVNAVTGKERAT